MKTVFEADTGLEAQMVLNLLESAGIEGEVLGEHLPGAAGELPPMGLVRVVVAHEDEARARAVIGDWQSTEAPEPVASNPAPRSRGFAGFVAGAAAASALFAWLGHSPVEREGTDFDGDGRLDEIYHWRGELLERFEADRNRDGEIDQTVTYARGIAREAREDNDFDGIFDTRIHYQRGNVVTITSDTNGDGHADRISDFTHGVLDRVRIVDPDSGHVRKIQRLDGGARLTAADWDADGDGELDTRIEYGLFEEERQRSGMGPPR